jgi:heat shock protein HtpX
MLVGTIAATMAGAIGMMASMARWGAIFGGFGGRDGDSRNGFELIIAAIVAPLAAGIIQMAISRQNEFQADATAAQITGRPMSLAHALHRLDAYAHKIPMQVNPAAAQLAIINPLSANRRGMGITRLFSTHPPTEERVARLQALQVDIHAGS